MSNPYRKGAGGGGVQSVTGTAVTGGTATDPVVSPTTDNIPNASAISGATTTDALNATLATTAPIDEFQFEGTGQTVGNTIDEVVRITIPDDTEGEFKVTLSGRRTVGGDAIWVRMKVGAYAQVGGTVSLFDESTVDTVRDPFVFGLGMIVSAIGADLVVTAGGRAGETWDWTCYGSRSER